MRRSILTFALCLVAPAAAFAQSHGTKIDWVDDPEFGLAKAKLEGRAALLFFTADW
jgi:hypothetical protein